MSDNDIFLASGWPAPVTTNNPDTPFRATNPIALSREQLLKNASADISLVVESVLRVCDEDGYKIIMNITKKAIIKAVSNKNQTKAAQYLGMNRGTYRKMVKESLK